MNVLTFGWEFPPFNSGGLGTACYGLTQGLSKKGVHVTFVVPRLPEKKNNDFLQLISAEDPLLEVKEVPSPLIAYMTPEEYYKEILNFDSPTKRMDIYGKNLFEEVERYAQKAARLAREIPHDLIHAHDWMTYKAGMAAQKVSGKPLIVHVHATEFDRTGGNGVHQHVYDIERQGMHTADRVIAVSHFTKHKIVQHYGLSPEKIDVVHNAVELNRPAISPEELALKNNKQKVVLFLGRITLQKGPDYFLYTAKRVLEHKKDVLFVMAGSGDMQPFLIEKAAELGIADKVLFTGFLRGRDVDKAYQLADLYVMPSVSEPFGITPLEALRNNVPVIISRQSGVSEVLHHCLKVDFWDVNEIADKIISFFAHTELQDALRSYGTDEVKKFDWENSAQQCLEVYQKVMSMVEVKC